jgi:hypothetical protein
MTDSRLLADVRRTLERMKDEGLSWDQITQRYPKLNKAMSKRILKGTASGADVKKLRSDDDYLTEFELMRLGWTRHYIRKYLRFADRDSMDGDFRKHLKSKVEAAEIKRLADLQKRHIKAPGEVDLLSAIFTVNRTAKRFRNTARILYETGQRSKQPIGMFGRMKATVHTFGLSTHYKDRKERLYYLKDVGIAHAYNQGRITCVGKHGNLAMYKGEGYIFHSTLVPLGVEIDQSESDSWITVEAKPKRSKEPRLKDAVCTLEELDENESSKFQRLESPRFESKRFERERGDAEPDDEDDERDDFEMDECGDWAE